MAKKKGDHVIMRNSKMFCSHCGREQAIPFPIEILVFSAMTKAFTKSHANCIKTWVEPVVDTDLSEKQRAVWWLKNGERGISSETIFETISGSVICKRKGHPSDPGDFKRCYLLLKVVPEWKLKLDLLRSLSPVWNNLVDNWDKLTEMLEEQILTKKANGMFEFMQKLGC